MLKFIVRRFFTLLLTMLLVSLAVFLITESSPGNVARNVLGAFVTPEQEAFRQEIRVFLESEKETCEKAMREEEKGSIGHYTWRD